MPIAKGTKAPHKSGCRCICCESSDILGKLDRYPMVSCGSPELVRAAAEEIRRLRNELAALRQENATLTAERDALWRLTDRLYAEHDALRAERDEVRQSYCSLMEAYRGGNGRVTANKLGWGYLFEEEATDER